MPFSHRAAQYSVVIYHSKRYLLSLFAAAVCQQKSRRHSGYGRDRNYSEASRNGMYKLRGNILVIQYAVKRRALRHEYHNAITALTPLFSEIQFINKSTEALTLVQVSSTSPARPSRGGFLLSETRPRGSSSGAGLCISCCIIAKYDFWFAFAKMSELF